MSPQDKIDIIAGFENNTALQKIAAPCQYYAAGTFTGLSGTGFIPRENTVISAMSGTLHGGATFDVLAYLRLSAAITLLKDELWSIPIGARIRSMTIDSGTIRLYS